SAHQGEETLRLHQSAFTFRGVDKMHQGHWLGGLLAVSLLLTGCHRSTVHNNNPPPDPLFHTKRPVEARATDARDTNASAHAEPTPPPMPSNATLAGVRPGAPEDNDPVEGVTKPVAYSTQKPVAAPVRTAAAPLRPEELYGHSGDYRQLQGVVERDRTGRVRLRFGEAQTARWGGRVYLDSAPRLSAYNDGDVIR